MGCNCILSPTRTSFAPACSTIEISLCIVRESIIPDSSITRISLLVKALCPFSISVKSENGEIEEIKTDCVLGFFGLIMKLGPIAEWGLNLEKKTIPVNTENFQTNKEGIFAIGDICTYPGKLKLILSGFHEGALTARACFKLARPNEKYRFEFTTTSKSIQEKLGVKKGD